MFENERKRLFDVVKFDEPGFDERVLSPDHSRFTVKPLLRGYGNTVGNALRRILLSDLPGTAVVYFKGQGITEQTVTIKGVKEGLDEIQQNIKSIRCSLCSQDTVTVSLSAVGPKELTAADLVADADLQIANPELHLLTLAQNAEIDLTLQFANGVGYVSAESNKQKYGNSDDVVYVDSIFSPVVKAEYTVEPARVGGNIDNDRLDIDVYTDGTIAPGEAVAFASKILIGCLSMFSQETEEEEIEESGMFRKGIKDTQEKELNRSVEELDFSVRSFNCLKRAGINTVRQLTEMTETEMLRIRNLGKKSFDEICEKLASIGLHFKEE